MSSPSVPGTGHVRRALAAVCAVGCAGLMIACGSGTAGSGGPSQGPRQPASSPGLGPVQGPAVDPAGLGVAPPASMTGLGKPLPGLSDRLVLARTQVTAGTLITGRLYVTNRTHRPVNLTRGCRPKYRVTLANPGLPPDVAFSSDCLARPFILRPGLNRLRVQVITTYQGCTLARRLATRTHPACLRGHRLPPLPAGRYQAVLTGTALPLPAPRPVIVTLGRPAAGR